MFVIGNTWLWLLDLDLLPGSVFLSWLFASLPVGLPPALKKLARDVGTKPALLDEALRGDWGGFLGDDTTFLGEFNFPVIGKTLRIQAKSNARYILYCYHQGRKHSYWESCQVWQWCCCCYNCWSRRVFERWHPGCPPGGTEWLPLAGIRSVDHSFETRSSPQIPWERKPTGLAATPSFFERQTIPK